jgi:peptidoglycan hydrolase-like protein with peptidoglycan-binding domain
MGVVAARLVFLALVGLTGAISTVAKAIPKSAPGIEAAKLPPVSTDLPPLEVEEDGPQLLVRAVQRELAARGFDVGAEDGRLSNKTRGAISAYEKEHGLPVTGLATDALLRHILLGETIQPGSATGSVKDATKSSAKQVVDVRAVQGVLADLGYSPGPIDGAAGEATKRAISAFQRDRKMAQTGRITPELLVELKRVTGRDLTKLAAER